MSAKVVGGNSVIVTELFDVEQITQNMRESKTGRRAVMATRYLPYFFMAGGGGQLIHRTAGVRVNFLSATRTSFLAVAMCNGATLHPQFLAQDDGARRRCAKCLVRAERAGGWES